MAQKNNLNIQEKLKNYDALYKELTNTGSMITNELNASLKDNLNCFEEFVLYTNELNSQVEPFIKKYQEVRAQFEKFSILKEEFGEIAQKALHLEQQISEFELPDIVSLKSNLDTVLNYLGKIEDAKIKAETYLLGAEGGIANVANYFSSLQSELDIKLSLISKVSKGNFSKENIDSFYKEISELPNPKIKNNSIPNLNNEDKINNLENSIESKDDFHKNPANRDDVLNYIIKEVIFEGKSMIKYDSIYLACGEGIDSVLKNLENDNIILKTKKSLKLSEEIIVSEKNKIDSEITNHLKLNKKVLLEYITSKGGSTSAQELIKALCENDRDKLLLKYELNALKEKNELLAERALVSIPTKSAENINEIPPNNIDTDQSIDN